MLSNQYIFDFFSNEVEVIVGDNYDIERIRVKNNKRE